jgi:hypothetical protein
MRDKRFGRIIFVSSESGVQIPTETTITASPTRPTRHRLQLGVELCGFRRADILGDGEHDAFGSAADWPMERVDGRRPHQRRRQRRSPRSYCG